MMLRVHVAEWSRSAACGPATALIATILLTASVATAGGASVPDAVAALSDGRTEDPTASDVENAEEAYGIRVLGIRRTAADYMLDFRFTVIDPEKAAALMDRSVKPILIQQRTGLRLTVPISEKIGPLRQAPNHAKANRNYFMFFANPGRRVKAGDEVTVAIGEFSQSDIVVQ